MESIGAVGVGLVVFGVLAASVSTRNADTQDDLQRRLGAALVAATGAVLVSLIVGWPA